MKWVKSVDGGLPVKSWCADVEAGALVQADNLARHPALRCHVALMPDCHTGYGMPIGGVVAAENAVIPSAVVRSLFYGRLCSLYEQVTPC